jgi:hypothetical protein
MLSLMLARTRFTLDRLAPEGPRITVDPDRFFAQRWPLFPAADWKAGRIPVCVVDNRGEVSVEAECDPITVAPRQTGDPASEPASPQP